MFEIGLTDTINMLSNILNSMKPDETLITPKSVIASQPIQSRKLPAIQDDTNTLHDPEQSSNIDQLKEEDLHDKKDDRLTSSNKLLSIKVGDVISVLSRTWAGK